MSKQSKSKIYPIKPTPREEYEKNIKAAEDRISKENPKISGVAIAIKAIMAVLTVLCASLLVLSIPCEYSYTYTHTNTPSVSTPSPKVHISEAVSEDEFPEPVVYVPVYYDFTEAIPESPAVGYEYFNDTVFIGDSRTKGLIMYTDMSPYDFSSVGTNVGSVQIKPFIRMEDENGELVSYTLFEALEKELGNYKAVYIALGLNELGWKVENFASEYRRLISGIRSITDVPIYIQLVMPVTARSSETTKFGITNDKAVIFNDVLRQIAAEMSLFLLDPTEMFALEDGTLNPAHASDGVHFQINSYIELAYYYRTHIVDLEAYDNTRTSDSGIRH